MAKIDFGGQEYDTDLAVDVQAILDKINASSSGESIPGVQVFSLPKDKVKESPATGFSLTTVAIVGGVLALLFLPAKK